MADLEEKLKNLLDSPDGMNQIVKTAQSLLGNISSNKNQIETDQVAENNESAPAVAVEEEGNFFDRLDPKVVTTAMQVMNEYRKTDDRRIQMLQALRLYFKDEDQVHINKAIQIVKLSKVAKQAFRSLREEDSFV